MKTKDLVYIGIIAYLAYLLVKKKPKNQETETSTTAPDGTTNNTLGTTVGNGTNGGLNLGSNMDLPNLTPTSPDGLSTEVALNSSNVSPIIKDNNPTQIYGNVSLPAPYMGGSVVNPNPVDVVPTASTTPSPTVTTTTISETLTAVPIQNNGIRPTRDFSSAIDTGEIVEQPVASTMPRPITTGSSIIAEPIQNNGIRPTRDFSSAIDTGEIVEQPIASTISTPIKGSSIISEPIQNNGIRPIKNIPSEIYSQQIIEQPVASTIPRPNTGGSVVAEPVFPIKTIKAELITNQPNLGNAIPIAQDVSDEMILECGNSFSIPNNDKEGSYTNYWFDGKEYYTQTTSPLIKTIPTKISKLAYVEGCRRLQAFKLKNSKL
jgi:hypothetical protein